MKQHKATSKQALRLSIFIHSLKGQTVAATANRIDAPEPAASEAAHPPP